MKEFLIVISIAIICITIIESVALMNGIDGSYLALSFTAIGGIIGVSLDHYFKKYKLKLKYARENKKIDECFKDGDAI